MTRKFVSAAEFRARARRGDAAGLSVKVAAYPRKSADNNSRTMPWVLSDGGIDRQLDTVNPNGWDLADFNRNPIVTWSHDVTVPPIGRLHNVRSDGTRLVGNVEFAPPEVSEFADQVYRMVRAGFISAGSVGFQPTDWSYDNARGGIDFHKQSLLEFAITPLPANQNSLVLQRAAKAMGLKTDLLLNPPRRARKSHPPLDLGMVLHQVSYGMAVDAMNEDELRRAHAMRDRGTRMLGGIPSKSPWFR